MTQEQDDSVIPPEEAKKMTGLDKLYISKIVADMDAMEHTVLLRSIKALNTEFNTLSRGTGENPPLIINEVQEKAIKELLETMTIILEN
jgi:hypothetical protein